MVAIQSVRQAFRKVRFYRVTGETRKLATPTGDEIVTWSSPLPMDTADRWLREEKGRYWGNTEPMQEPQGERQIRYRVCDCWLACGECWCVR